MAEENKQEKKIIIDEDWKNKAQKEKEVLKDKQEPQQEKEPHQLPPGDFGTLVSMLATQAMFAMGFLATEKDKEPQKDLMLAKFHIDMLESLEQKTKGNLTEQEQKLLTGALSQLRMGFVEAAK